MSELRALIAEWRKRADGPIPTDRAIGITDCARELESALDRMARSPLVERIRGAILQAVCLAWPSAENHAKLDSAIAEVLSAQPAVLTAADVQKAYDENETPEKVAAALNALLAGGSR